MGLNLSSCATIILEEVVRFLILAIQKKMHKSIQTSAKFFSISNHFPIFLKRNFFLHINYFSLILNKDQFGIYWKQYILYLTRDVLNQAIVRSKISLKLSNNRFELRVVERENKNNS